MLPDDGFSVIRNRLEHFFLRFADRASQYISVINQLDAQNLFYNKFISCLYMFRAQVLETCTGMKLSYCKTNILFIKLVN